MPVSRVDVGIKGFEKLVEGGFLEQSPILLSGSPGTGKTIFSLQYLYSGLLKGEPGIYITFEEPKQSIMTIGENFGWNFEPYVKNGTFIVIEYFELGNETYLGEMDRMKKGLRELEAKKTQSELNPSEFEDVEIKMADYQNRLNQIEEVVTERKYKISQHEREQEFLEKLRDLTTKMKAKRLVIDSLSAYTIYDESRESLHRFIRRIRDLKTTTLLISEHPKNPSGFSRDEVSEFVCDGVVVFEIEHTKELTYRKLHIEKMRHTKIDGREKFIWFTDQGIEIQDRPQEP
jgi:KaiC/GvpD/RAD55 family RecA-like ATPase